MTEVYQKDKKRCFCVLHFFTQLPFLESTQQMQSIYLSSLSWRLECILKIQSPWPVSLQHILCPFSLSNPSSPDFSWTSSLGLILSCILTHAMREDLGMLCTTPIRTVIGVQRNARMKLPSREARRLCCRSLPPRSHTRSFTFAFLPVDFFRHQILYIKFYRYFIIAVEWLCFWLFLDKYQWETLLGVQAPNAILKCGQHLYWWNGGTEFSCLPVSCGEREGKKAFDYFTSRKLFDR